MTVNDRIVHSDLMNMGIVFLEKAEERAFLRRVNDEFAYLAGLEALNLINGNDNGTGGVAVEDIRKFLEKDQEKCGEIVNTVRVRILQTLKERRKVLLGGSGKQETCFMQSDSGDDIKVSMKSGEPVECVQSRLDGMNAQSKQPAEGIDKTFKLHIAGGGKLQ